MGLAEADEKTTAATVQAWINLIAKGLKRQFVVITFNVVVELDVLRARFIPGCLVTRAYLVRRRVAMTDTTAF